MMGWMTWLESNGRQQLLWGETGLNVDRAKKDKTETTDWGVVNSPLLSCAIQWKNPEALRAWETDLDWEIYKRNKEEEPSRTKLWDSLGDKPMSLPKYLTPLLWNLKCLLWVIYLGGGIISRMQTLEMTLIKREKKGSFKQKNTD